MRILIDIGHPAHVHYFKNFIKIMKSKNFNFLIIARDKEVTHQLLSTYQINYISRGKGGNNFFSKLFCLIKANFIIYKHSKEFNPDLFLSFASPYAAQVSKLFKKPHISFTDTEHAKLGNLLFIPFTDCVITPSCYKRDFKINHVTFNSYMELCYLHPKYFNRDKNILNLLGISENEKFVIVRFVSWNAAHDFGKSGINYNIKLKLINILSNHAKVLISSESELPEELKKYKINIKADKMHDALSYCSLFIGEGATMASECAMIGTPAIYINSLEVGYCTEQEKKYNLILNYRSFNHLLIKQAINILNNDDFKSEIKNNHKIMLQDKINPTDFMVWFIENYPNSIEKIKSDPGFLNKFK